MVEPKNVIVEFLTHRLTDPRSRISSKTETFNGNGSTTTFTLTPTSGSGIYCITAITIDSVASKKWQDYTFDPTFQSKVVTFNTAPGSGTNNVSITYSEGTSSWIYPDLARTELQASSYPRINVMLVSGTGVRAGSETSSPSDIISTEHYQIDIWVKERYYTTISSKTYAGDKLAMYFARQINLAFKDYIDDLYPKLKHYDLLNIRDAVWETDRQVFHVLVECELQSENIGE